MNISNTVLSYIYTDVWYSIYRCFKYISQTPMFFIHHLPMFQIYISQAPNFNISIPIFYKVFTDVLNAYLKHRCFIEHLPIFLYSIHWCSKCISQTTIFHISIPIFHTVLTDFSNVYLKHLCLIYLFQCFIQYSPMFQIYIQTQMSFISIQMFHTVFTDVSNAYLKQGSFIQYLPMFQIYILNTDVPYT
jgi:hypothetical protein